MPSDFYAALSGALAMESRLNTVANNVANMSTPGFKAEVVNFEAVLSSHAKQTTLFAQEGVPHISMQPGAVQRTGNALDVAIQGDGFLQVQTGDGPKLSRDGRMTIGPDGILRSVTGYPVLDGGGAEIAFDPAAGQVTIGTDGTIVQDDQVQGQIGLFTVPAGANITPAMTGDALLESDQAPQPVAERGAASLRQGYIEDSNVDPIRAITELITVQRHYEHMTSAKRDRLDALQEAINSLGE
ncbi:MAG: flagellar basal-body rod protein FlgF [Pseudomonadota bacterium]